MRALLIGFVFFAGVWGGTSLGEGNRAAAGEKLVVHDAARKIAKTLLDEKTGQQVRRDLVARHPALAAEIVAALVAGFPVDTEEEYVRIPWIWRVAIAATKKKDLKQIRLLLQVALPKVGEPLYDWQAVVVGGAVINGITLAGQWPQDLLQPLLQNDPGLKARWAWALQAAQKMADNRQIKTGTRYDALRMLGMLEWDAAGGQLFRYIQAETDPELKQGAIGGLADMQSPFASQALLSGWSHYGQQNRFFTFEALLRTEPRFARLKKSLAAGQVELSFLTKKMKTRLLNHPHLLTRQHAQQLGLQ